MNGRRHLHRRRRHPPLRGVFLYRPGPRIRLEKLLARVRELRKNLYPPGWTYDPLYLVEQEIADLLDDI